MPEATVSPMALVPERPAPRPPCPFYGFSGVGGFLVDTKGNQYAILVRRHCPCEMEMQHFTPEWKRCHLVTVGAKAAWIKRLKDEQVQVFPDEFRPKGAKEWEGIDFGRWFKHVTGEN